MFRFDPDLREAFPSLVEKLDRIESFVTIYEDRFVETYEAVGKELTTGDRARVLLVSALATARALTWVTIHSANGGLAPGVNLAARAHFEITGLAAYAVEALQDFVQGRKTQPEFETLLTRLFMGRRTGLGDLEPSERESLTAINALTLVDSVDKLLPDDLRGAFREGYDWLCEFCHPNSFARFASGHELRSGRFAFRRVPSIEEGDLGHALAHLILSQTLFFQRFDDGWKLLAELQ